MIPFKIRVIRQGLTEEGYLSRYLSGGWLSRYLSHVGMGGRVLLAEGTVGPKALGKECAWQAHERAGVAEV